MLRDDLRFAVRHLRRRPGFALTVTATLAVTIAAATTAFGFATAVLWRPLPFRDAGRLVFLWEAPERDGQQQPARVTAARYFAWRRASTATESMALFGAAGFTVDSPTGATSIRGVRVSANYFDTLGIGAALGRTFVAEDEQPGRERVVLLSNRLWQQRFGGRTDIAGTTLTLSGAAYTIVGVMPTATYPAWPVNPAVVTLDADGREFWVPIPHTPQLEQNSRSHVFGVLARLGPGVTAEGAAGELTRATRPTDADPHAAHAAPLRDQFVADARTPLLTLAAAALAVLLIACANLAALYVSAYQSRRNEFAVRAAIGAGAWRLVAQMAVEAWLLAALGGALGLAAASIALRSLPALLPPTIPFVTMPTMDLQVAVFAAGIAMAAAALLSGWPILRLILDSPAPRGAAQPPRSAIYRVLVVAQIAVTVALAAAAGLLAQSLWSVRQRDPGFAIDRTFVADVGLPVNGRPDARAIAAQEQAILTRIAALPGVTAVATAYDHPLEANWSETTRVVGDVGSPDEAQPSELRIVSPGYTEAMAVAVIEGRSLSERDDLDAPGAMLVNAAFARAIGGHALGRRIRSGTAQFLYGPTAPAEFEIVGVVENERSRGLEQPAGPAVYLSTRQFPQQAFTLVARTSGDPMAIANDVKSAIRGVNSAVTVDRPESLEGVLAEQMAPRRLTTDVVGGFAAGALVLAALGIYGLLSVVVAGRTREIGVRLALGATPGVVAGGVVRECLMHTALGLAIGIALAVATGRLIAGMLVGVQAADPLTLGGVAMLLALLAFAASALPARRAARIDAAITLRAE